EAVRLLNPPPPFLSGKYNIFIKRGNAYLAKDDRDRALIDYAQAVRVEPANAIAHRKLAEIYMRWHDYVRATQSFDEVNKLLPTNAQAWNDSCWVRAIAGQQLQKALANCNEALRLEPDYSYALDSRGLTYLRLGQPDKAIADYDAALKIRPNLAW